MRFESVKILLVDDNQHMRLMLIQILRAIGIRQVLEAGDGAEGLQLLRDHDIDIIITDLAMQPLDGIDFMRLVRHSPESPNPMCPVIMITGHSTQRRVEEARDAGVNEFLAKPVTPRGVLERIGEIIDNARPYVRAGDYFGPDRRRRVDPDHVGPWRRAGDPGVPLRGE